MCAFLSRIDDRKVHNIMLGNGRNDCYAIGHHLPGWGEIARVGYVQRTEHPACNADRISYCLFLTDVFNIFVRFVLRPKCAFTVGAR